MGKREVGMRREWGVTSNKYGVSFLADENGLKLDCSDSCTAV